MQTVKFDKYKHRKCPWVTQGILISIKYRDSIYRQLKSQPIESSQYDTIKLNFENL
jgi:hypothetical protein